MRILTVFYSLDGNCRALAEVIHGAVGGEAEALRPMKVFTRQGGAPVPGMLQDGVLRPVQPQPSLGREHRRV